VGRFRVAALRLRALASLLLALERRRIAFHPKAQTARLRPAMMRLQQGFAASEMGLNDKFALQKIWLFSNSGRAGLAGDGCCGAWDQLHAR
jgi:hypothetical protein